MRKIIYILITCLAFSLSACHLFIEEPEFNGGDAPLTIIFNSANNTDITRITQTDEAEKTINNVYVLIFNDDNQKVFSKFYTFSTSQINTVSITDNNILGGENMTVAVIANINNNILDANNAALDSIKSIQDFNNAATSILSSVTHPIERGTSFLMSGEKSNVSLLNPTNTVNIDLSRIDAKIKFNITVDNATYSDISFTPREWRVVSYPQKAKISNHASPSEFANNSTNTTNNFSTSSWYSFEQAPTTINSSTSSAFFSFYSLENILNNSTIPTTGTAAEQYALRDKQNKNIDGTNDDGFKFAPDGATYVEFKGDVKYTVSDHSISSADVLFRVHLGGVNQSSAADVNNFSTYRNTFYTYNVRIKGVDDITTEVTAHNEIRPGAEGDIIVSTEINWVDAYNSIFNCEFAAANIDNSMTWAVSTPFSNGTAADGVKDYKWVYFRYGTTSGNNFTNKFRHYPGDNNVYPDELNSGNVNAFLNTYITEVGNGTDKLLNVKQLVEVLKQCKTRSDKPLFKGNKIQFTVFVLENHYMYNPEASTGGFTKMLWQQFANTEERAMDITSRHEMSADGQSSHTSTQLSIRQASIQTMYNTDPTRGDNDFTAFGSQYYPRSVPNNPDKEASFTQTKFTNTPKDFATDMYNGRENTLKFISIGDNWSKYINRDTWALNSAYDYPMFEFLLYNRDMDGDNKIDKKEIQWYLTSINQLSDLWIGEDAIHPEAKLYFYENWVMNKQLYISSTISYVETVKENINITPADICDKKNECGHCPFFVAMFGNGCGAEITPEKRDTTYTTTHAYTPYVLWSSEGSSAAIYSGNNTGELYYRIVRNLGLKLNETQAPDRIYECELPTSSSDGSITLSRLSPKSLRNPRSEQLPVHELRDPAGNNKPAYKFYVCKDLYDKVGSDGVATAWTSGDGVLNWYLVNGTSDDIATDIDHGRPLNLPNGWRVPNQRELALMFAAFPHTEQYWPLDSHFCRTGFCDAWQFPRDDRNGFYVEKGGTKLSMHNRDKGGVRPVKDELNP